MTETAAPIGTVTFLLTDVEGSTRQWAGAPEGMRGAVERHDTIVQGAVATHGGTVLTSHGEGDSFFAVFPRADGALRAAVEIQRQLAGEPWPEGIVIQVRIALHSGDASSDYRGPAANRCARVRSLAYGGQILLSAATAGLVADQMPAGLELADLGEHRLRDLTRPERVFQLQHPDLQAEFPPLRSLDRYPHNLPLQPTRFVGREAELAEVKELIQGGRLLTLTGSGGSGKTRLALQAAADLLDQNPGGTWFVELASLGDPSLVPQSLARTLGLAEEPGLDLTDQLVAHLSERTGLLLLDNCEHLVDACAATTETLMRSCQRLSLLATSREALHVAGETTWRIPSLPQPAAVELFAERARAAEPSFVATAEPAPPWSRSAAVWTASRSPSSWRPRGSA